MRHFALRRKLQTDSLIQLNLFFKFFWQYLHKKFYFLFSCFEKNKTLLVDGLVAQRGRYIRPFLHTFLTTLFVAGLMLAPVLQSSLPQGRWEEEKPQILGQATASATFEMSIGTEVSLKPRDSIVDYKVQRGDTLTSIAKKFDVSLDTIRWQNNLRSIDDITPGQTLKIPPVTGVIHKVARGETIYSIAKAYAVDAQAIVNWPFNTFTNDETFALAVGQTLMVPDGVKPEEKLWGERQYLARKTPDAGVVSAAGAFVWPTSGDLTQYFRWYHPGVDIANQNVPDILAADAGKVLIAGMPDYWGYGTRVLIDHDNGFQTLYAHLSKVYVSPGQTVKRGDPIGQMGSTGRSSGIHLHFEIHKNGIAQNPLDYLK